MSYIPIPEPKHKQEPKFELEPFLIGIGRIVGSSICGVIIGSFLEKYIFHNYEIGLIVSCIIAGAIWEILRGLNQTST